MGQDLSGWFGAVLIGGHTELGADVISSRSRTVSSMDNAGEVSTLLCHI